MIRRIIDYSKLTDEVLSLLSIKFPEGIDEDAIFTIENSKGERLRVVEVRDEESIFLVKVSTKMEAAIENFEEDDETFEMEDDASLNTEEND
jgi:DNA-directed RNA polymerase subunit delta